VLDREKQLGYVVDIHHLFRARATAPAKTFAMTIAWSSRTRIRPRPPTQRGRKASVPDQLRSNARTETVGPDACALGRADSRHRSARSPVAAWAERGNAKIRRMTGPVSSVPYACLERANIRERRPERVSGDQE
jgi:hypothetical protein